MLDDQDLPEEQEHNFTAEGRKIVNSMSGYVSPIIDAAGSALDKARPVLDIVRPVFGRISSTNKKIIAIMGIALVYGTVLLIRPPICRGIR